MKARKAERPSSNYTKYPNSILDDMMEGLYSGNETLILNLMIRKNIGYTNPNKKFSQGYLSKCLKLSINTIKKALKLLLEKEVIKKIGTAERGIGLYDIVWTKAKFDSVEEEEKATVSKSDTVTMSKSDGDMCQNMPTIKDNIVKENKVKENNIKADKKSALKAKHLKFKNWIEGLTYKTLEQVINLSPKEIGQLYNKLGKIGYRQIEKAFTQASLDTEIQYTFNSLTWSPKAASNIASLAQQYDTENQPANNKGAEVLQQIAAKSAAGGYELESIDAEW